MKRTVLAMALMMPFVSDAAYGATTWVYKDVAGGPGVELTSKQFTKVSGDVYRKWDANKNSRIENNEFYDGLYTMWDADRDGRLTESEYTAGWGAWGRGATPVAFNTIDKDGNAYLERSEFVGNASALGYPYARWDADKSGWLDENEFNTGLFGVWDKDSNDVLAENEFDEYADDGWF